MAAEPIPNLFERARAGDRDAWESIYLLYNSRIRSFLLRETGDEDVADDLTADTFYKAMRGLHACRDNTNLLAWIYRIASNLVIDRGRRSQIIHMEEYNSIHHEPLDHRGPELFSLSVENMTEVSATLGLLPVAYQEILRQFYFEHLSLPEIAERTGSSRTSLKSRLFRARAAFRELHRPALLEHRVLGPLGLDCVRPIQRAEFLQYVSGCTIKEIAVSHQRSQRIIYADISRVLRLMGFGDLGRVDRYVQRKELPTILAAFGIPVSVVARNGWALPGAPLLPHEKQVLAMYRRNISSREMSRQLGVAETTIRRWRTSALAKLGPSFRPTHDPLTRRQRQHLAFWASGETPLSIARRLRCPIGRVASGINGGRRNVARATGTTVSEVTQEYMLAWLSDHPATDYSRRHVQDDDRPRPEPVIGHQYDDRRLAIIQDLLDGASHRQVADRYKMASGSCSYFKELMCWDCQLPAPQWREAAAIILARSHGQTKEETEHG